MAKQGFVKTEKRGNKSGNSSRCQTTKEHQLGCPEGLALDCSSRQTRGVAQCLRHAEEDSELLETREGEGCHCWASLAREPKKGLTRRDVKK